MTNTWSWTTWDSSIGVTTVRKTFALRKTESRMPPLHTPTQRQSHFCRGSSPQAIFRHRWTQPNWHPYRCQQQAIKNQKTTRLSTPRKHQHRDPHVSHCTHHLYIDDACAIKLGPTRGPRWCLNKTATIKSGHTFPMQSAQTLSN